MIRHLLVIVIALLLLVAATVAIPFFTITELMYPVRKDSLYLRAAQMEYEQQVRAGRAGPGKIFLYHPRDLGLAAASFSVLTHDSATLKSWYVSDSLAQQAVVLFVPDISESKQDYIMAASELAARGLSSCLLDMRMQGESGGRFFTFGRQAAGDVLLVIDTLRAKFGAERFVVFGSGTGASVAVQAAADTSVSVVILQNPFSSLEQYIRDYADARYGLLSDVLFPLLRRKLEKQTGLRIDSVDLRLSVRRLTDPALFISSLSEAHLDYKSAGLLYERCASARKEWLVFRRDYAEHDAVERKKYYDRLAAFIRVNLPARKKKAGKFKRLVRLDPAGAGNAPVPATCRIPC